VVRSAVSVAIAGDIGTVAAARAAAGHSRVGLARHRLLAWARVLGASVPVPIAYAIAVPDPVAIAIAVSVPDAVAVSIAVAIPALAAAGPPRPRVVVAPKLAAIFGDIVVAGIAGAAVAVTVGTSVAAWSRVVGIVGQLSRGHGRSGGIDV